MRDDTKIFTGRDVQGGEGQRLSKRERHGGTASRGGGGKGGPSDPGYVDPGGRHY